LQLQVGFDRFDTQAVAKGVPVDVAQKVLGHASVSTTSIYVQAEKERTMAEAKKFFEKLGRNDRKRSEILQPIESIIVSP
jgi:site-specific recombinase XerD